MNSLNGRDHDGRALKVNEAKPMENRGGGGGFGGGPQPLLTCRLSLKLRRPGEAPSSPGSATSPHSG
jgi:hypothetical protein